MSQNLERWGESGKLQVGQSVIDICEETRTFHNARDL